MQGNPSIHRRQVSKIEISLARREVFPASDDTDFAADTKQFTCMMMRSANVTRNEIIYLNPRS